MSWSVPLEGGSLRRSPRKTFFLCKSEFVLSTTSTCSQVGLFLSGSLLSASSMLSLSWSRLLQLFNKQNEQSQGQSYSPFCGPCEPELRQLCLVTSLN